MLQQKDKLLHAKGFWGLFTESPNQEQLICKCPSFNGLVLALLLILPSGRKRLLFEDLESLSVGAVWPMALGFVLKGEAFAQDVGHGLIYPWGEPLGVSSLHWACRLLFAGPGGWVGEGGMVVMVFMTMEAPSCSALPATISQELWFGAAMQICVFGPSCSHGPNLNLQVQPPVPQSPAQPLSPRSTLLSPSRGSLCVVENVLCDF